MCFNVFSNGPVPNVQCHVRVFEISDCYVKQINRYSYRLSDFYQRNRLNFDAQPSDLIVSGESAPMYTIFTFETGTFVAVYAFNNLTNAAEDIAKLEKQLSDQIRIKQEASAEAKSAWSN